jgi:hypothetical protein
LQAVQANIDRLAELGANEEAWHFSLVACNGWRFVPLQHRRKKNAPS